MKLNFKAKKNKPTGRVGKLFIKRKVRRTPEIMFDEGKAETLITENLVKWWGKIDSTPSYLKKRFDEGHPLGDWLKLIAKTRLEMRDGKRKIA